MLYYIYVVYGTVYMSVLYCAEQLQNQNSRATAAAPRPKLLVLESVDVKCGVCLRRCPDVGKLREPDTYRCVVAVFAIAADVLHRHSSLQMTVLRWCAAVVLILIQTSVDGSHQPLLLSCCCFTCASSSGTMTTTQPLPAWAGLLDVFGAHQVSVIVRPPDY
jgi:hypothetical protein